MENNISLLIGLKNNIEYTKFFYQHTRELYPDVEIVFVSYGSTDGTNIWLDNLEDSNVKYFYSEDNKTLSDTYNKATSIATKKYVCFLHNDMVLGKDFLENLSKSLDSDNIFCYKVVEPPIFDDDNRDWKIIKDFGDEFKTFKFSDFYQYEKEYLDGIVELKKITVHTSFFLSVQRETLLKIGGLDSLFNPMFCEDDDLILRLKMLGLKTTLVQKALVYHFVSKTSRFSEEFVNKTRQIEAKSHRNFIRKWGFSNTSKSLAKYDIGIVLEHGNLNVLSQLEPYSSVIYVDFPFDEYIDSEQKNTKINLANRIKSVSETANHDVMIYINGKKINGRTINTLHNISDIIIKNKIKNINPSFFAKSFYKMLKPYKPLIYINKSNRLETQNITKSLEV